ncbi:tetratricopeptide repeat protein 5-like [Epargyreus clarus]|uniref:tetratricopeptide repeat protein 5-like n=1 Tax=Epargyreus clarus TaxID=520877 RepID=UPI003C30007C
MSLESEDDPEVLENVTKIMAELTKELDELYAIRDLFFEKHSIEKAAEKHKCIEEKKKMILEKFDNIDVDTQIPFSLRGQFLYLKGKCFNITTVYDSRATQCLSKAVKLNPHLVDAWNELGECYWKNMNIKEAKASFEGALKHERNRVTLRSLSIMLRQESKAMKFAESKAAVLQSVELAKEAVAQDIKDGISWTVLGNAYLCQYFGVTQDPEMLKLCMSAYKQASLDPVARGQPDLYYNKGIALRYDECFEEALKTFEHASLLDPAWSVATHEQKQLTQFLTAATDIVKNRGKLKTKRIMQMVQSIDEKMLGPYAPGTFHTFGGRNVSLTLVPLSELREGPNEGKVVLGRVVGSVHNENCVPFAFALVDSSMQCVCALVYNWAGGRGAIIGDCVALPEPRLTTHTHDSRLAKYDFKSIRVNNPTTLIVNGRRVSRHQVACTRAAATYEPH